MNAFFRSPTFLLIAAAAVALLLPRPAVVWAQNHFQAKVVRVLDGDQVQVEQAGHPIDVHLHGIDCKHLPTPELRDRARQWAERRLLGTTIRVTVRGVAPDQSVYGDVQPVLGKTSLNRELVSVGLATWTKKYAPGRSDLALSEQKARRTQVGLWGADQSGASIKLPPPTTYLLRQQKPTPKPTATPVESPITEATPEPEAVTATPMPRPRNPQTPKPTLQTISEFTPAPPSTSRVADGVAVAPRLPINVPATLIVFGLAALATIFILGRLHLSGLETGKGGGSGLIFRIVLGAIAGLGAVLLLPLPLRFFGGGQPLSPLLGRETAQSLLITGGIAPLVPLCLWGALRLCRREQVLRATPLQLLAEAVADGRETLIKASGRALLMTHLPQSVVGHITGVYVQERTQRYEIETETYFDPMRGRSRRRSSYRWVTIQDETQLADFLLDDNSGAGAVVEARHLRFHPLRIVRYYNEVPVESWFSKPYSGDTRTEIRYIPANAPVTVWGRLFRTATPDSEASESHIGYDALNDCAEVVEGEEDRLWSARPFVGLLLTLAAVALSVLVAWQGQSPTAISVIVFWTGFFLLLWLILAIGPIRVRIYWTERTWDDCEALLRQRWEKLPDLLRALAPTDTSGTPEGARLPVVVERIVGLRDDAAYARTRAERLIVEQAISVEVLKALGQARQRGQTRRLDPNGEWAAREKQLAEERERYNDSARTLNGCRRSFPGGLIARALTETDLPLFP